MRSGQESELSIVHVDDQSNQDVPSDPNDVPGLLEKIPISVHVSTAAAGLCDCS